MLAETKLATLHTLVEKSSEEELLWMSGYLAGLVSRSAKQIPNGPPSPSGSAVGQDVLTILYGTETGNAKKAAMQASGILKKNGLRTKLAATEQYKLSQLSAESTLLIVISTQGEGEPPAAARQFFDYLHNAQPDLTGVSYSVLALGSKAYPLFCQAGIDVDAQMKKLGATQIAPLQTCDEDFENETTEWVNNILQYRTTFNGKTVAVNSLPLQPTKPGAAREKQIFEGTITLNTTLNDDGSIRMCNHIEIAVSTPFLYEAGDAIGIIPENDPALVAKIISLSGLKSDYPITYKNESHTLQGLLQSRVNILHLSERKVKAYAALLEQEIPEMRMDFYDLLRIYPLKDANQFLESLQLLDGLTPRIYTLSSAPLAHGENEIHLTVLKTTFEKNSEQAYGLCSAFLCNMPPGTAIRFFLHRQKNFRLPAPEKPVIMIGPGTGIAPFRAFLWEREATGAEGENWLFFGEHDFVTDFYYQTELQAWKEQGLLTEISLGFEKNSLHSHSMDTLVRKHGVALWQWITRGASLFVSGEKEPMCRLVEDALIEVISQHGNMPLPTASDTLKRLAKEGRYAKDVY